jgi:hypothetical protein
MGSQTLTILVFFFFFRRLYNPSGFRPAELSLSILSKKVSQSADASGTSNPYLEKNQGFIAYQLSPQEAPGV